MFEGCSEGVRIPMSMVPALLPSLSSVSLFQTWYYLAMLPMRLMRLNQPVPIS
jgi:hypothetical protein